MARETKVVQSHPDKEMQTINYYQSFGWEVIGNQRCQEQEKRYGEWYTVTFNKITFTRDTSAPWYNRVIELEERLQFLNDKGIKAIDGSKFGIDEPERVGKPTIAEKGKFFTSLIVLIVSIIGTVLTILKILPIDIIGLFAIVNVIACISTIANIGKLEGLTGQEAEDALNKYYKYRKELSNYTGELEKILDDEYKAIETELKTLINN